jgi:hypothetical protein
MRDSIARARHKRFDLVSEGAEVLPMRVWVAAIVLLLVVSVPLLRAQETVDSTETDTATPTSTVTTSTVTTTTASPIAQPRPPAWIHFVRIVANAGPIVFLLLAWTIGFAVHWRLVRKEQQRFPIVRGSRAPQTVPMILTALLFLVPAVLFAIFEVRSRLEIRRGIGGVVDEWQPVTTHAWMSLLICLVLALTPWLFARRADSVS